MLVEISRPGTTSVIAPALEPRQIMDKPILHHTHETRNLKHDFGLAGKSFELISTRLSNSALRGSNAGAW